LYATTRGTAFSCYQWEKQAREGALQALRNGKRGRKKADPTVQLQAEVERLRAVVAELSAENLQLKKELWP
jgi:transposase-like protein